MTKDAVLALFGSGTQAAKALGITKQGFSAWPEDLDYKRRCWVIGAAVLSGKAKTRPDLTKTI